MSNDKKQNLQDTFLNSVRKSRTPLTIFLVNGVKLQGVVGTGPDLNGSIGLGKFGRGGAIGRSGDVSAATFGSRPGQPV